jgi:CubicO group peptidase (beta-lactamase class C family)
MKKNILLLAFLSNTFFLFSQSSRNPVDMKALTDSIEKIIQEEHITGLMLGITTNDSVLFSGGFGYADISTKRPVDEHTLFRLGSVTKMFVSLGIMKLVNEGKLNLNDELAKVAPEVPFSNEWERTDPVRIVHLLEHSSGFDDIQLNRMYSLDTSTYTDAEMMLVQKNSLHCRWKPGERQSYSNPNYAILGYIIRKLSGNPYDQYLTETILKPLGMNHSNFNLRSKGANDTKEYIYKNGQPMQVPSVTIMCGPAGALWSSASDMIKFLQLFLKKGAPLFNEQTITEIETTHSPLCANIHLKSTYALGNFMFNMKGEYPWRGHAGIVGTCYSSCYYCPELHTGFVLSSNSNKANTRIEELISSYFEQHKTSTPVVSQPLDEQAIAPFLGYYQFESPRNEISSFIERLQNLPEVYLSNGKLYFKPLMGDPTVLIQTAPYTFIIAGTNTPSIVFAKNAEGKRCMLKRGNYFEQTSSIWAFIKRIALVVSLLFLLSSFILGIVSLGAAMLGKLKWTKLTLRIAPMIGFSLLSWAVYQLLEVLMYSYKLSKLGTIQYTTLVIFCGTLAFGLISVINLFFVLKAFPKMNRLLGWYLLLTSFSMCLIAGVLWANGWIGLRTWEL